MMLNAAGFEHVYRAQPADILIPPGSNRNWRWSFFYGVKGNPLRSMSAIDEETPPLKVDA
jgi:hypothetical protein